MALQPLQSLSSVYSFRRSISLLSSVEGIFSHVIGDGTRTLQDLVKLLHPLRLALYQGTDMHDIILVGEGGSYQVFRCNHLKKQLVAAKIMRIPLEKSAEEKANFRRRVFCLIKDLEVMHHPPLAQHPNILRLLGYGWNLAEASALPFLVTEYAERGTLRHFLRKVPTCILSKLSLCGNIASGLHAMHRCGVAHGDLKLENVLVFKKIHKPGIEVTHYSAKVSDFGNSFLTSLDQAFGSPQSYRGKVGYIPPEVYQPELSNIIWALALVVWETLFDGSRYTEDRKVASLIKTLRSSQPKGSQLKEDELHRERTSGPDYESLMISDHLCQFAVDFVEAKLGLRIRPMSLVQSSKYFVFTPWASKLPYATKAQMVADAKFKASGASEAMESKVASALYVGIAYWVGYGVRQNMEESLSWISRSANQGSPAASLILDILDNPHSRYNLILSNFKISFEGEGHFSRQANCRFGHESSEASELSSFSSVDGCNPLHYLSLFEGLVEHQSCQLKNEWDLLKRKDLRIIPIGSQTSRGKDEECVPGARHAETQPLDQIVSHLGLNFIYQSTKKVHYLDTHFPMILDGTPLSFAITLNCREAIEALVNQLGNPSVLRGSKVEPSDLETAVSCHHSQSFRLLWSSLLETINGKALMNTFIYGPYGSILIGAIAKRSTLERTILHGPCRSEAQTRIILLVIWSMFDLITQEKYDHNKLGLASDVSFMELVSGGVERVLDFGDLEIAIELRKTITFQAFEPNLAKACRHRICQAALKVACSGYVDLQKSKQFLDFARDCIQDEDPDFQTLKTIMEHKSESLFRLCLEEGFDILGRTEDGQGLVHYMIKTGFHSLVPISLLIDKGADPFHASNDGQTPLDLAVKRRLLMVVDELLSKDANPLAADKRGSSTLLHAIDPRNYSTAVEIRKTCKANIGRSEAIASDKIRKISVALRTAAKYHDIEMIKLLLHNGARTDVEDSDGDVALHYAVQGPTSDLYCAVSCCQLLCNAAKYYLPRNKEGNTPLHYAAERYKGNALRDILTLFVKQFRFDIDVQNRRGETILHQAARQASIKSFAITCTFGATLSLKDGQGLTAGHLYVQATCHDADRLFTRNLKGGRILITMIDSVAHRPLRDGLETARGSSRVKYAAINRDDALISDFSDVPSQVFRRTLGSHISHDLTAPEQWLSSAWSFSVKEELWHVVRELLLKRPYFDPDTSLLVWPKGARLLKHAITDGDTRLLRRSTRNLRPLPASMAQSAHSKNILKHSATLPDFPDSTMSKISGHHAPNSSMHPGCEVWSAENVRSWENSIRCDDVHQGRDPLYEIFHFMVNLDWPKLRWYYSNANHQRSLASMHPLKDLEHYRDCSHPYHAGLVFHGKDYLEEDAGGRSFLQIPYWIVDPLKQINMIRGTG